MKIVNAAAVFQLHQRYGSSFGCNLFRNAGWVLVHTCVHSSLCLCYSLKTHMDAFSSSWFCSIPIPLSWKPERSFLKRLKYYLLWKNCNDWIEYKPPECTYQVSIWFPSNSNMVPGSLLLLFLICIFRVPLLKHAVYTTLKESGCIYS